MTNRRQQAIDAAAAKALLLEPGDSFVVPLEQPGEDYAEESVDELEAAIRVQYDAGVALMPDLAEPSSIGVAPIVMPSGKGYIVVDRAEEA